RPHRGCGHVVAGEPASECRAGGGAPVVDVERDAGGESPALVDLGDPEGLELERPQGGDRLALGRGGRGGAAGVAGQEDAVESHSIPGGAHELSLEEGTQRWDNLQVGERPSEVTRTSVEGP